jgi:hypothetical protein
MKMNTEKALNAYKMCREGEGIANAGELSRAKVPREFFLLQRRVDQAAQAMHVSRSRPVWEQKNRSVVYTTDAESASSLGTLPHGAPGEYVGMDKWDLGTCLGAWLHHRHHHSSSHVDQCSAG